MGVDAEELIVRPFNEVVERGNEAIANAHAHAAAAATTADNSDHAAADLAERLARAGRAVVREGARAVKRLQPVWDDQVEKYGEAFKDAMLQQDDIEKRRRRLEDLLYDFEDYTEPATFDADKFAELQAATRAFALDVLSHTKRLKLEAPKRDSTATQLAAVVASGRGSGGGGRHHNDDGYAEGEEEGNGDDNGGPTSPPTRSKTFPPLPPLPPMPPMPHFAPNDRRFRAGLTPRSSLTKAATTTTATMMHAPRLVSLSGPRTPVLIDEDEQLREVPQNNTHRNRESQDGGHRPASASRPESRQGRDVPFRDSAYGSRHGSTKSVGRTTGRLSRADHDLYDSPLDVRRPLSPTDLVGGAAPLHSADDDSSRYNSRQPTLADVLPNHRLPSSPPSPQLQPPSAAPPSSRTRPALRKKASKDTVTTVATDYSLQENGGSSSIVSHGTPLLLARLNSLTVDGSVRSGTSGKSLFDAATTTAATSPVLTDARTSFLSSSPDSDTSPPSSPYATFNKTPPLPPLPPLSNASAAAAAASSSVSSDAASSLAPPFIAPPIASSKSLMLPPPALPPSPSLEAYAGTPKRASTAARTAVSRSIQDFIKFAPSPPVPPISLPLSPTIEHASAPEDDPETESEQEPGQEQEQEQQAEPEPEPDRGPQKPVSLPPGSVPSVQSDDIHFDHGLMLADDDAATSDMPLTRAFVREPDCSIGPRSSFHQMGGFCKGAELFRSGGHWQGVKQAGGYVANKATAIGRCVGCGYAHNYEEVRLDIEKKPEATFTKAGVRFRLRLLYKSHLGSAQASQRLAESHYACVFCVHAGATVREGDATVFTSADHLLLHLARHPQPLPAVPGMTVLYGTEEAAMTSTEFDLHFVRPPLPTNVPSAVGQGAVATAVRAHLQRYGAKKLARPPNYPAGDLLPFLAGARIVGLVYPEKWGGKWCLGWHDGVAGAFPAKAVQTEPPRPNEIPMESSSGMSVTARWKWKPSRQAGGPSGGKTAMAGGGGGGGGGDGDGFASAGSMRSDGHSVTSSHHSRSHEPASVWLEFDKGETISNVKCLYADHWCWAGTNSKGQFGVFPKSHIVTKTLRQENMGFAAPRPMKSGWSTRSLFRGGGGGGNGRRASSSNASSLSGSTGRTRYT
ncbi:Src-domain containing protein [Niveomyces insectorum RCEF 264]|uniref:Src-domain containing protein n=1 Tax=Niveomyces insectorum RCEF 264 TaxID=1081102 RepID=A0A167YQ77_9HYPO|nr:Src-domain containing protein [Niveomyces insectorum RCEF 264]